MTPFSENDLIMVAILPSPRDYEIARVLGWYRIPLRMAPKIIDVDYLAFYQTGSFGTSHRWQIEHFAPVLGHELTTRADLLKEEAQHPRANEEYFKIQIGPMRQLSAPIPAGKWKRITFLYTLGSLFNRALMINDLVVKDEDREILWKCLRERRQPYAMHNASHQLRLFTDDDLLILISSMIHPETDLDFKDF